MNTSRCYSATLTHSKPGLINGVWKMNCSVGYISGNVAMAFKFGLTTGWANFGKYEIANCPFISRFVGCIDVIGVNDWNWIYAKSLDEWRRNWYYFLNMLDKYGVPVLQQSCYFIYLEYCHHTNMVANCAKLGIPCYWIHLLTLYLMHSSLFYFCFVLLLHALIQRESKCT